ncbi:MAG: 4Fe-4S dicluster domain-containing protein [Deltaproteobacteria bacterium]|jgi:Fe-S-cluster-containing hydrogenase component 2|nr:4Fe-4S dicluster domain-containing protein [Deltaproteobacteria bacterium]
MTTPKTIRVSPHKCIGCLNCELGCAMRDWGEFFPSPPKINLVFFKDGGGVPVTCFQCDNAPCLAVCQTGALARDESGVIASDPRRCVGCGACAAVCPFGNVVYDRKGKRVLKCDQCGGEPRCVKACPSGALKYEDDTDAVKARREAFARALKAAGELS